MALFTSRINTGALFILRINTGLVLEAWNSSASPAPAVPINLRTTATTSSTISLAVDGVTGTYTWERAPVSNGTPGTFAAVYTGPAKTYQDGPLTFNTTYAYRVKVAVNGVGSAYSNVLIATTSTNTGSGNLYAQPGYMTSGYSK